ncbi:hypothetical protein HYH03_019066, partial [Edaphochlamys debaryana]
MASAQGHPSAQPPAQAPAPAPAPTPAPAPAPAGGSARFYAVAAGRQTGVFGSWEEAQESVRGFSGARFRRCASREEAEAFVAGRPCPGTNLGAAPAPAAHPTSAPAAATAPARGGSGAGTSHVAGSRGGEAQAQAEPRTARETEEERGPRGAGAAAAEGRSGGGPGVAAAAAAGGPQGYSYGVAAGRRTGVFGSWEEAQESVRGFSGARFRRFSSRAEAEAFVAGGPRRGQRRGAGRCAESAREGGETTAGAAGPRSPTKRPRLRPPPPADPAPPAPSASGAPLLGRRSAAAGSAVGAGPYAAGPWGTGAGAAAKAGGSYPAAAPSPSAAAAAAAPAPSAPAPNAAAPSSAPAPSAPAPSAPAPSAPAPPPLPPGLLRAVAAAPPADSAHPLLDFGALGGRGRVAPGRTYCLWFDGGSRRNPGSAGFGAALTEYEEGEGAPSGQAPLPRPLEYSAGPLGQATNNVAEWAGLTAGLQMALDLGVRRLVVRGDSRLVIQQAQGLFQVSAPHLRPFAARVGALVAAIERGDAGGGGGGRGEVRFEYVPRASNRVADALSNLAMDAEEGVAGVEEAGGRGA